MLRGRDPQEILNWRASEEANDRLSDLIEKEHDGTITESEQLELNNQMFLEHIATLMKARTMQALVSRRSSSVSP